MNFKKFSEKILKLLVLRDIITSQAEKKIKIFASDKTVNEYGQDVAQKGKIIMKCTVLGIRRYINKKGNQSTVLYVTKPFTEYLSRPENSKSVEGEMVDTLYAGEMSCQDIGLGSNLIVSMGEKIKTKDGKDFQPIEDIVVLD